MGKYISTLLLAIIIFGCDLAKELQAMGEKQAKFQNPIQSSVRMANSNRLEHSHRNINAGHDYSQCG